MKRMFSILLSAALLLSLLPACNQQAGAAPTNPAESGPAAPDVSAPVDSAPPQEDLSACDVLLGVWTRLGTGLADAETYGVTDDDGDVLSAYIEGAYGLKAGEWEDAALARETGASAVELAVLRFADEDAARHGEDCLKEYLHRREGDFTGYAPNQAKLVADGALSRQGRYVGLFICEDSASAESAFIDIIRTGELPAPAEPAMASFRIDQLMLRLVVETACPEWFDLKDRHMTTSGGNYERLIEGKYGISQERYKKYALAWWGPFHSPDNHSDLLICDYELAVFQAESEAAAAELVNTLNSYLEEKEARLREEGQTDAAELVHSGQAAQVGPYALLAVCDHTEETIQSFHQVVYSEDTQDYYDHAWEEWRAAASAEPVPSNPDPVPSDRVPFTQPNQDDMSIYDTSAIRAAWEAGDPSGLSEYDRETYDAARAILGEILTDGMTGLEKEAAIYYWLVNNVDYDWRHQDIMAETPRSSYEPYGGLVDYTAVCLGYATSFQLLMDLAGVECITVSGAAFHSEEPHGWNMVRLNGNWYCVDVTWDANYREYGTSSGQKDSWRYFNVTSDRMAATDHQWDYANTPEATAEDHGRG